MNFETVSITLSEGAASHFSANYMPAGVGVFVREHIAVTWEREKNSIPVYLRSGTLIFAPMYLTRWNCSYFDKLTHKCSVQVCQHIKYRCHRHTARLIINNLTYSRIALCGSLGRLVVVEVATRLVRASDLCRRQLGDGFSSGCKKWELPHFYASDKKTIRSK